jgi:hypothetical protein
MATKKCPNGHQYDSSIYGDNCPFCPSGEGHTHVNEEFGEGKTKHTSGWDVGNAEASGAWNSGEAYNPTRPMDDSEGGHTIIRTADGMGQAPDGGRRMVGLLVSYSQNPSGDIYKVYEGRTLIGRDRSCDISFPSDSHMSGKHLLIQFVEAKGAFKAKDQGSSNGSFINGTVYVMDESVELKTNDVIVLGQTKLLFIAIPSF